MGSVRNKKKAKLGKIQLNWLTIRGLRFIVEIYHQNGNVRRADAADAGSLTQIMGFNLG